MKIHSNLRNIDMRDEQGEEVTTPGPMPPASGRRLGRYLMFEEIARGEMGSLHLGCALAPDAPRAVAIKHLYPWLAANSSYASTYLREARLAARIRHPNVAKTIDVITGPVNGELYLVMDYVPGDTLAHLLSQTRREGDGPPLPIVTGIMAGLLRGLHAVQEATLAEDFPAQHAQREVSPQDVIVGLDGVTRIFEFGAIHLAHGHMREMVSGRGADVFSAGAMLWEILAGRRLFGDPADRDVFFTSATSRTAPPSHFNPEIPPELDAVVLRALRKERDRRFLNAHAFADAIEAAVAPASAREIGDWVARTSTHLLAARAVRVAGITRMAPKPVVARPKVPRWLAPPRPWRRVAAVLAVAVMVAGALIGAGLWARASEARRGEMGDRPSDRPALHLRPVVDSPTPAEGPAAAAAADDDRPALAPPAADVVTAAVAAPAPALSPAKAGPQLKAAPAAPEAAAKISAPAPGRGTLARGSRPQIARVAKLNRSALKAYRRMDPITARRRLHAALAECARTGLTRHPVAARTHALLGVVLAGGFKQPELGADQFKSALRIDPGVPLPPRYASEADVAAAFRAAVAAGDLRN